ncbi:DUF2523 family protein [Xanthomonas massiliensis]|uniref:DUF2523 family protein n=1 Tax=Xanthomonas massiliensis TaxID=1720302 RepID=UPI0011CC1464|nr:DUF2523 family protein [Xanthomonas massiliensis]
MAWLLGIFSWIRRIGPLVLRIFRAVRGSRMGKWIIFYLMVYGGGIVAKIIKFLGLSFVVNKWVTPTLTNWFAGKFAGLDATWIVYIKMVKLDSAITVVLSAIAIAAASNVAAAKRSDALNQPL